MTLLKVSYSSTADSRRWGSYRGNAHSAAVQRSVRQDVQTHGRVLGEFYKSLSVKFFAKFIYYVFQIFKVTPWFAFLILFLSLKDRLSFYNTRKVARTLDVDQGPNQIDKIVIKISVLKNLEISIPPRFKSNMIPALSTSRSATLASSWASTPSSTRPVSSRSSSAPATFFSSPWPTTFSERPTSASSPTLPSNYSSTSLSARTLGKKRRQGRSIYSS